MATGVSEATGVSLPVRPTWMRMLSICVMAARAANLYAVAQRGALPVKPNRVHRAVWLTFTTTPSIS